MTTLCESQSERIDQLLALIWRKAPALMRTGDLIEDADECPNPAAPLCPLKAAEITRRFFEQQAAGRVNCVAIARAVGVSPSCVRNRTRQLRTP